MSTCATRAVSRQSLRWPGMYLKYVLVIITALSAMTATTLHAARLYMDELVLPEGFVIDVYAHDVVNARQMALGDKGTLFVGSRTAGNVYALRDTNGDSRADEKYLVAKDLNMPSGIAFKDGSLYVGAVNRILRYDDIENRLSNPPEPVVITDSLPDDEHHGWKYLGFGPDGYLYVPVGVPCNICLSSDERHGTILKMNAETGAYEIFASGIRNSVGFDWHPQTKQLWFTDNGRDWMGDDLPPDELNRAPIAGLNFGFPYVHGVAVLDPQFGARLDQSLTDAEDFIKPSLELGAHVAPLGMTFHSGKQFPESYRGRIFIAEHGSWNRSDKTGYRVISVTLNNNRVVKLEPFVTGWLDHEEQTAWGRPVDIINMPDGSMLVSDDYAGAVYRIWYSGGQQK